MKVTVIDCYGNRIDKNPELFHNAAGEKRPHLVDKASSTVTYMAFDKAENEQPVHKIVKSGNVTTWWWQYGLWENRASLTYDLVPADVKVIELVG